MSSIPIDFIFQKEKKKKKKKAQSGQIWEREEKCGFSC